jgi:alkanesulfonate monooxygenase SsuD/methylene tetrahydromethanopterin reductase-like flavin-dependent oxidoreductase (luciferase family)
MVGSRGPKALRLLARYADAWNASIWGKNNRPEDLEPGMSTMTEACIEVGRDPATLERTAGIQWSASDDLACMPDWLRMRFGPPLTGAHDETVEVFRAFARAGVSHLQVIIWPHTRAGLDAFRPILEALDAHPTT